MIIYIAIFRWDLHDLIEEVQGNAIFRYIASISFSINGSHYTQWQLFFVWTFIIQFVYTYYFIMATLEDIVYLCRYIQNKAHNKTEQGGEYKCHIARVSKCKKGGYKVSNQHLHVTNNVLGVWWKSDWKFLFTVKKGSLENSHVLIIESMQGSRGTQV